MSESVVIDTQLNSPIDKVWSAITDSETLSKWMMFKTNTFKPTLGHAFQFSGAQGYDQTIECEVTALEEPNTLAYTWSAPGQDGQPHKTVVTFNLTETEEGTHLNLVQSGFNPDAKQELGGAKYGWEFMLGELENVLAAA